MNWRTLAAAAIVFVLATAGAIANPQSEADAPMNSYQKEAAAVGGLRIILSAQEVYAQNYPENGYACSLAELTPPDGDQARSPQRAALIDASFRQPALDGYKFEMTCVGPKPHKKFQVSAVPETPNKELRAFCTDQSGSIRGALDGKANTCFKKGEKIQ